MTIQNRFYNWFHGVKRFRQKGCRNVGVWGTGHIMVKYDWSKPLVYMSRRYSLKELIG